MCSVLTEYFAVWRQAKSWEETPDHNIHYVALHLQAEVRDATHVPLVGRLEYLQRVPHTSWRLSSLLSELMEVSEYIEVISTCRFLRIANLSECIIGWYLKRILAWRKLA